MRLRHVAAAVNSNRHQRRFLESCADENQSVSINRPRDIREPFAVSDLPDLFAGLRFVSDSAKRSRAYYLIACRKPNDERSCVGLISLTSFLPSGLSRRLVERRYELEIQTVTAHDQQIIVEHR